MNKIILTEKNEFELYKYGLYLDCNDEYSITIGIKENDKFDELISTTGDLKKDVDFELQVLEDMEVLNDENKKTLLEIRNITDEEFKNIEYIDVEIDLDIFEEIIKDSKTISTKKIIFNEYEEINLKMLDRIKKMFKGKTDNLYFNLVGNDNNIISFDDCYETYKKIEEIANHINNLDLSPMEKIMYAYDIVRERIYKEVKDGDDKNKSRTISSVILGDEIVCVGYTRILEYIFNIFGIENEEVKLESELEDKNGHMINLVHIKDDKYDIDGYYYLDATADSKKSENDRRYFYTYTYFAKTKKEIDKLYKKNTDLKDNNFSVFEDTMIYEFEDVATNKGIDEVREELVKSINYMFRIDKDTIVITKVNYKNPYIQIPLNIEKIVSDFEEMYEKFDRKIPAEKFLKILYNVRKCQYYENPEKYPFNMRALLYTLEYSEWDFDEDKEYMTMMLTEREKFELRWKRLLEFNKKDYIERDIGRIKLAKVLSKVYEKRLNNNK